MLPLFSFFHAYGEEEFSSYFIDYVDHGKKATVGVVCVDSFALNKKETSCEVAFYKTSQKSVERRMLFQNKGGWRTASKDLGPKMNEQDQFYRFYQPIFFQQGISIQSYHLPSPCKG